MNRLSLQKWKFYFTHQNGYHTMYMYT